MNILHHRTLFKMKSLLCMLLVLYGPIALIGCGNSMLGPGVPLAQIQIALGADHPLTQALAGTNFQGAVAMDIFPGARQFRLVFPDDERQVSGSYDSQGGEIILTQVNFKNDVGAATVEFDAQRRVDVLEFLADDAETDVVHTGAAVLRGDGAAEQPELGHLRKDVTVEPVLAIEVANSRPDLSRRPFAHRLLQQPLLFGQIEINHEEPFEEINASL